MSNSVQQYAVNNGKQMSSDVQQYAVNDQIMRIYDSANNDDYVHIGEH